MLSTSLASHQDENAKLPQLMPLDAFEGSLSNRVFLCLKDAILSLAFQPGEKIRKAELCDHLGVSRSPVAEAVTRLAADGLVDVIPQAGTFVARFSMEHIREGAFLREALELAAVEAVAGHITDDQITQLRRNLRLQTVMVEDEDFQGFYELDAQMHEMVLSFTGYPKVARMAENSWLQVNRARRLLLPQPGRVAETLNEHRKIIDALANRDADAARLATRDHLRRLIQKLEPLERDHPELFMAK
ncbi:GntR family transcriptional regulator [Parasulfitobacter algicola]|uniref:GntR family transcriptional regulator n=1 Tax=Parasulfitobacter algicola TaxID=2614809 RepID=A0ABX2IZG4_9RHOB|nr:GntR family transcriptional regulator [Sulfitobacter algicola]NSX56647.1 GntR family transcriptional regulator [Sulfitobacter algicola]